VLDPTLDICGDKSRGPLVRLSKPVVSRSLSFDLHHAAQHTSTTMTYTSSISPFLRYALCTKHSVVIAEEHRRRA
jgi:hypothetical protein